MKKLVLSLVIIALFFTGEIKQAERVWASSNTQAHLQSVQADFLQEKHLKVLSRPILSSGTFLYQAPQSLRWEYVKPLHSVLIMHNGEVKKFVERDGALEEEHSMQLGALDVVLTEISSWLNGRFSENSMFSVEVVNEKTVRLVPKDQTVMAFINEIEIKLADADGLLDSVTIYEGPDAFTRMTFSNRRLNQAIPPSRFTEK